MPLFSNKGPNTGQVPENEYMDILEPVFYRSHKFFEDKSDPEKSAGTAAVIVVAVTIVLAVVAAIVEARFGELNSYVHIAFGVPLGFLLFVSGEAFLHFRNINRKQEDPSFLTLKEHFSPAKRTRTALIVSAILIVLSAAALSHVPYLAGGTIALAAALSFYNYIRRTPEEFERLMNGEPDPRDIAEIEEEVEEQRVEKEQETQEYLELLESLPEEQRKILLNPRLNGAISLVDEDDIKGRKKRRLFGK